MKPFAVVCSAVKSVLRHCWVVSVIAMNARRNCQPIDILVTATFPCCLVLPKRQD